MDSESCSRMLSNVYEMDWYESQSSFPSHLNLKPQLVSDVTRKSAESVESQYLPGRRLTQQSSRRPLLNSRQQFPPIHNEQDIYGKIAQN